MTWERFRAILAVLLAAFPKLEPDEATLVVWFALLQDLEAGQVERAVIAFCQTARELYPGTNIVASLRELACPDAAPPSWLAWQEARELVGQSKDSGYSHPRIKAAVEAVGWTYLAFSENPEATRAHFIKAYEQLSHQERLLRLSSATVPKLLDVIPMQGKDGRLG